MSAAAVTRRVQRLLLAGLVFLLAWQVAVLAGTSRHVQVVLGLYGFVFHVVFAKAYSLVPSYFARELAVPGAPTVQLPLSSLGVLGLAAAGLGAPAVVGAAGAALWLAGVLVFVGTLAWTLRDNPTGAETGTGEAKADRRAVDRYANAFVPVVLLYLLAGAYDLLAARVGLPTVAASAGPPTTHLLAAGAATLLVLAVGFRLLPRLLVETPPTWLVVVSLPAGAIGPILLAREFLIGLPFQVGAVHEAVAVVGFAVAVGVMVVRSDRRRVGVYAVLAGAVAGLLGVLVGLDFAFRGPTAGLADAHARLNLLGFLGLTIVGVTLHFYPPGAGRFRGAGDRTAFVALGLLVGGLSVEVVGLAGGVDVATTVGRVAVLAGSVGYAYLVAGLLRQNRK